jgi:hypothetical protein
MTSFKIDLRMSSNDIFQTPSFSPRSTSSSISPKQQYDIDSKSLYDLLMLLRVAMDRVDGSHSHNLLSLLFVESKNEFPDLRVIFKWIKTRLRFIIHLKDAEILVKYVSLFRPLTSETLSEYEAFQIVDQQDPLLLYSRDLIGKEEWCEKTDIFIFERKRKIDRDRSRIVERKTSCTVGDGRLSELVRSASTRLLSPKVVPVTGIDEADNYLLKSQKLKHVTTVTKADPVIQTKLSHRTRVILKISKHLLSLSS